MLMRLRFPTRTRFGWLVLLILAVAIAGIEDEVFQVNGILGRVIGVIGVVVGTAGIIEFVDHFSASPHKGEEKTESPATQGIRERTKYTWIQRIQRLTMVILAVLLSIILLFLLFMAI